jgi:hypothetical protein
VITSFDVAAPPDSETSSGVNAHMAPGGNPLHDKATLVADDVKGSTDKEYVAD